ncbi:molybdate ABC transporter substrate-binding protein [Lutimaribacter sp. EGI FJ00015]|uniref:Molybdate ABC transporter substrate-binding protein n=1 Tax=Lutimaribacter degradans TaxID=2945989 RepID=A0ACC5ZZY9_9RHOB|nr:molybdate ABC transporter substrate-binding protein [Lutimaribacter sp. EGI FJ00013]MCM2563607.1 molybdate ABC transporter substrate-binding protein [Lutimaribacter sp. EGI FJ00013]MCO0614728.1 molybdate ABC transporter substrate-binding protein [Lutimaribacter sp. EGI FJ00015]MCO0637398.1 molybdate ABC transporter substrate-binding protein [Lutimaribacter sp. EGI FJ00014]
MPNILPRRAMLAMLVSASLLANPAAARAETALAAVAANFAETAEALLPAFRKATGHDVELTTGSTGKLYAQIGAGAPFDLLLSADTATPTRLLEDGNAISGTEFTYAVGRLALWSADPDRIGDNGRAALENPDLRFVAIANPNLAPYGVAAREALTSLGLWAPLQPKIVMGQNIGQTNSMVASGAAEIGFVALSAVLSPRAEAKGSHWDIPQDLFTPIRQNAVLLNPGADNEAARAFLDFLRTPEATAVIDRFGYGTDN